MDKRPFQFKQFSIFHDQCAMKVGTDGVLLGAWADVQNDNHILDIGTGSGLIAIMLAQRNSKAMIHGIEIDPKASAQAINNANNAPWNERISIENTALQNYSTDQLFDHIITNPPYFKKGTETPTTERNNARQQLTLSFKDIIAHSISLLNKNGKLSLILPTEESREFISIADEFNLRLSRRLNVRPKKDKKIERVCMEFSLKEKKNVTTELIIQHEERNDWTDEYIQLTGDFYLKM